MDGEDFAETACFKVSDLVDVGQVVDSDLVPGLVCDLHAIFGQEHGKTLFEVWLKSAIFLHEFVNEKRVFPAEC